MSEKKAVYLGIDCGATTSKVAGMYQDESLVSDKLRQARTRATDGAAAMVEGWMQGLEGFIQEQSIAWEDVLGVGLAIPGPYRSHGVLGVQPNLPKSLDGWRFLDDLQAAVNKAAGRDIPVETANDGQLAGLGEATHVQAKTPGSLLMLSPGSGLGAAFVKSDGTLLKGDNNVACHISHMPAPYEKLGLPVFSCGCGRDWGCFEAYTSISGLVQLLKVVLPKYPSHPLNDGQVIDKEKTLGLRDLAQEGDELALEMFDIQARAMGHAVATGGIAFDVTHVVIGGGLMDLEATTPAFRKRYMKGIQTEAAKYSFIPIENVHFHEASLGELSQGVGAAKMMKNIIEGK